MSAGSILYYYKYVYENILKRKDTFRKGRKLSFNDDIQI
jgi:hypothetical protein